MYESYWGLLRPPFQNKSSVAFYYPGEMHQAALLKLKYLVESRLGAGLLTGGMGYGKTLLAEVLRTDILAERYRVVHVLFPKLSPAEFLAYLADELEPSDDSDGSQQSLDRTLRRVERILREQTRNGSPVVLLVDEAQLIEDRELFQTLQLLLNYRQRPEIDLTLILIGDWTLGPHVDRVGALADRIAVRCTLRPLSAHETAEYVLHRLKSAGATQGIFDQDALDAVFEISGGVPLRINRLCDVALLVGFADQARSLSAALIESVADEVGLPTAA